MILKTWMMILLSLIAAGPLAGAPEEAEEPLRVVRLGERMIFVSDGVMGEQLAINSKSGIVVFDTLWSKKLAQRFRERMADDLSANYELVLPISTFSDRRTIDLGDMTLTLIHAGTASRGEATLVARIPELKLVLFGRLMFHDQHRGNIERFRGQL